LGITSLEDLLEYFEDDERDKFLKMFRINKVLGTGGFGVVVSAKDKEFNKNVALKIVYKKDIKAEMLRHEYEILSELNHENIIKIYSFFNFSNFVMMSMKLTKENLHDYASRRRKSG
jgi:serine/threonine protein kinase